MGVSVRPAVEADIPVLIELGAALHAESPRFSRYAFSPVKVAGTALFAIAGGGAFVAENNGKIIGVLAGFVAEQWFSTDRVVSDLTFYITPEQRKKGRAALMLIRAFEQWAVSQGAMDIVPGASTQIDPEGTRRFYEKLGYTTSGYQFFKRLTNGH